jgi:hypothetical protein
MLEARLTTGAKLFVDAQEVSDRTGFLLRDDSGDAD